MRLSAISFNNRGRFFAAREPSGSNPGRPAENAADHTNQPGARGGNRARVGKNRRIGVGRRGVVNRNGIEKRHPEREMLFRAPDAGRADADWPDVWDLIKVASGTPGMSVGALAAEFIQAPSVAVAFIAILKRKPARVKMGAPRTMIVNDAVKGKLGTVLLVQFRKRSVARKLEDDAK